MLRAGRVLAVVLVLLVPLALASGLSPPTDAGRFDVAGREAAHWVGSQTNATTSLEVGSAGTVWVAVVVDRQSTNASELSFYVNVTGVANGSTILTKSFEGTVTSEQFHFANFTFIAPATAGPASYHINIDAFARMADGNMTKLGSGSADGTFTIQSAVVPAPPAGIPTSWLVAAGIVFLLAVALGAWAARQRSVRRKMRGETRSRALQELEREERAKKRPEEAAVLQQEIRQEEKVREQRRDLQILEAKRADVARSIDLLTKRHEAGGLSKFQYDAMVGKKRAELERIEAELREAQGG